MNEAFATPLRVYRIRSDSTSGVVSPFSPLYLRDSPADPSHEHLVFHIESGDYFGTLATVMGLIADTLSSGDQEARKRSIAMLGELRHDLVYLQGRYTIVRN